MQALLGPRTGVHPHSTALQKSLLLSSEVLVEWHCPHFVGRETLSTRSCGFTLVLARAWFLCRLSTLALTSHALSFCPRKMN